MRTRQIAGPGMRHVFLRDVVLHARIGIYDATGRLPLPSEEAVLIKRAEEKFRVVNLSPRLIPWPAGNPKPRVRLSPNTIMVEYGEGAAMARSLTMDRMHPAKGMSRESLRM